MSRESTAFESIAGVYDHEFTWTSTGKLQRNIVWTYLQKYIPRKKIDILEINCGTGEDAIWFAKKRHRVFATDISGAMIMVAESKRIISGLGNLRFQRASFGELSKKMQGGTFDLVFSNFGGINCVNRAELMKLAGTLDRMLKPGGRLIMVIMGRKCAWERWFFFRRGEKQKMFRRLAPSGVLTSIGGEEIIINYYSPSEVRAIFHSQFRTVRLKPVGLFLPPSYLEPYFRKRKWLLKILSGLEWTFGWIPRFSDRADHYIIEMEKRD